MPRALQAGETGGGSGRWGGIGRQRWHIHTAVSEHADGDGLALLQQAKDLLRRAEFGDREFADPPGDIKGHTAGVVDDGIAAGATIRVALRAVRSRGPSHLVMAVPV